MSVRCWCHQCVRGNVLEEDRKGNMQSEKKAVGRKTKWTLVWQGMRTAWSQRSWWWSGDSVQGTWWTVWRCRLMVRRCEGKTPEVLGSNLDEGLLWKYSTKDEQIQTINVEWWDDWFIRFRARWSESVVVDHEKQNIEYVRTLMRIPLEHRRSPQSSKGTNLFHGLETMKLWIFFPVGHECVPLSLWHVTSSRPHEMLWGQLKWYMWRWFLTSWKIPFHLVQDDRLSSAALISSEKTKRREIRRQKGSWEELFLWQI